MPSGDFVAEWQHPVMRGQRSTNYYYPPPFPPYLESTVMIRKRGVLMLHFWVAFRFSSVQKQQEVPLWLVLEPVEWCGVIIRVKIIEKSQGTTVIYTPKPLRPECTVYD